MGVVTNIGLPLTVVSIDDLPLAPLARDIAALHGGLEVAFCELPKVTGGGVAWPRDGFAGILLDPVLLNANGDTIEEAYAHELAHLLDLPLLSQDDANALAPLLLLRRPPTRIDALGLLVAADDTPLSFVRQLSIKSREAAAARPPHAEPHVPPPRPPRAEPRPRVHQQRRASVGEPRPFDFASLDARLGLEEWHGTYHHVSDADRAARLGLGRHQIIRLRRLGLTEHEADVLACHIGLHPGLVWPSLWWALPDQDDVDDGEWLPDEAA